MNNKNSIVKCTRWKQHHIEKFDYLKKKTFQVDYIIRLAFDEYFENNFKDYKDKLSF